MYGRLSLTLVRENAWAILARSARCAACHACISSVLQMQIRYAKSRVILNGSVHARLNDLIHE